MYKKLMSIFLIVCVSGCSGCRFLENAVSDIQGWDVSACVDGFGVCWELFWDNSDKFEDGFIEAMNSLTFEADGLATTSETQNAD